MGAKHMNSLKNSQNGGQKAYTKTLQNYTLPSGIVHDIAKTHDIVLGGLHFPALFYTR